MEAAVAGAQEHELQKEDLKNLFLKKILWF
jgi:hypothetical protein